MVIWIVRRVSAFFQNCHLSDLRPSLVDRTGTPKESLPPVNSQLTVGSRTFLAEGADCDRGEMQAMARKEG